MAIGSNLEIITTSDGSHSLLNTALNETYHSHHGAVQESKHVFIEHGLHFFETQSSKESINIFEVGFGTGLNALLTLQHSLQSSKKITYHSIETFPLQPEIWKKLNYTSSETDKKLFRTLHESEWDVESQLTPRFTLLKIQASLHNHLVPEHLYDVVYFDAFAPNKQPDMWTLPVLEKIVTSMSANGVFVTYCAKGQLKRDLKSLGLEVQTLPGPPGKKEMTRALKRT